LLETKTAPVVRPGLFKIRFDALGGGREEGSDAEQGEMLGRMSDLPMNGALKSCNVRRKDLEVTH